MVSDSFWNLFYDVWITDCPNLSHKLEKLQPSFTAERRGNISQTNMKTFISIFIAICVVTTVNAFGPHAVVPVTVDVHQRRHAASLILQMSIPTPIDTVTSGLASICRTPFGVTVRNESIDKSTNDPIRIKVLYDIENSPNCRRVRELLTELDINVDVVVPATTNSRCFLDPNHPYYLPSPDDDSIIIPRMTIIDDDDDGEEVTVEGVDDIIAVLESKYSATSEDDNDTEDDNDDDDKSMVDTKDQVIATLQNIGNYVATALRIGRGMAVSPAAVFRNDTVPNAITPPRPNKPLILYSYEGNQFCRLVREVLTELDVYYELRSTGKGSIRRRTELAEITGGSTQCPFLIDPNTDTKISDSTAIIQYLYQTYAIYTPPNELVQWASDYILPLAKPVFSILAPIQAGATTVMGPYDQDPEYQQRINAAWEEVQTTVHSAPVVVYTYGLSPFSTETKALLENMNITYTEVSLGMEWIPGLIKEGGSEIRAAFLEKTGQSSLPHVFIHGQSIGGLFSGKPGLLKLAQQGTLKSMIENGQTVDATKTPAYQ
jgi:glutaredoxin